MVLQDKIIDFLGDSITEGMGVTNCAENRYDNVLKNLCGLRAVYNYGISGTRLAHQCVPSEKPRHDLCFCGRAYDLNPDADIIVVYGGVNDYIHGDAPIGQYGDKTPATFYGAVRFLMKLLRTLYADKTIVFLTPARIFYFGMSGAEPSVRPNKRPDALPLLGYTEIVKKTAADFDIPVLDMHEKLGIDPTDPEQYKKFTVDGLHFNDIGHHRIAACLRDFLEAL